VGGEGNVFFLKGHQGGCRFGGGAGEVHVPSEPRRPRAPCLKEASPVSLSCPVCVCVCVCVLCMSERGKVREE